LKDFALILCAVVLFSCASSARYSATLDDRYNDGAIGVSLVGLAPEGSSSPVGLTVKCTNASAAPVTVEWQRSTFSFGKELQPVFVAADQKGDSHAAPSEATVAAGSSIVETVYPASNIVITAGGWGPPKLDIRPIGSRQVLLSLCLNVSGQDRFYALQVQIE
jgi:hypothetical protein